MDYIQKSWAEVQAEDNTLIESLNRKLLYMLNVMKRKLAERGIECELSISIALAVIELRMSIIFSGESIEAIDDEYDGMDDQVLEEEVETDDNSEQQSSGVVKRALMRGVDKMLNGLAHTRDKMSKLGISGKIGASAMIGAFGCEISIGVDITLNAAEILINAPKQDRIEND